MVVNGFKWKCLTALEVTQAVLFHMDHVDKCIRLLITLGGYVSSNTVKSCQCSKSDVISLMLISAALKSSCSHHSASFSKVLLPLPSLPYFVSKLICSHLSSGILIYRNDLKFSDR